LASAFEHLAGGAVDRDDRVKCGIMWVIGVAELT
jgi:hypothetical protein